MLSSSFSRSSLSTGPSHQWTDLAAISKKNVSYDVLHALCVPLGCSLRSLCFVYSLCAVLLCVLLLCAVALGTFGENAKYVRYFAIA